ncbi:MAG TPA: cytochrome c oxidase subunit 3 [Humisphaera sp.]|jgi:heme/copper-type cytochrome/quinol oxidase subunit 3|nr:cytochrome c oxidase subunit 3 [Humisphaera sp.]
MHATFQTVKIDGRYVLDVSGLPEEGQDSREPVWWGNALLIIIESMTILLLLVSYFYIRRNFTEWPPPQPRTIPPLFHPVPDLPLPTIELVVMIASCFLMYWTDMAARRDDAPRTKLGLWIMLAICLGLIVLRFLEMRSSHLKFRWDDNAYGSVIWVILGTHLTYLLGAAAEFFIMLLWIIRHALDPKHGLDVTLAGGYWYWATIVWILCYATVFIGARVL